MVIRPAGLIRSIFPSCKHTTEIPSAARRSTVAATSLAFLPEMLDVIFCTWFPWGYEFGRFHTTPCAGIRVVISKSGYYITRIRPMSNSLMRLLGILSQDFVNDARTGAYIDGAGLWLVVTERGRRYELRDGGAVPEYVGDAKTMTIELARRRAIEMREERYLGTGRMPFGKPLKPVDLHRFVNAWVSASIAAAAA
jgi:hypothetical protein